MTELRTPVVVRVSGKLISHFFVEPQVLEEVVALKYAMVLHHPVIGIAYEGLQNGGRILVVVVRGQHVADVVEESAHHVLGVLIVSVCASCGLNAVLQAIHGKPASVLFEFA